MLQQFPSFQTAITLICRVPNDTSVSRLWLGYWFFIIIFSPSFLFYTFFFFGGGGDSVILWLLVMIFTSSGKQSQICFLLFQLNQDYEGMIVVDRSIMRSTFIGSKYCGIGTKRSVVNTSLLLQMLSYLDLKEDN